jgi:hypothetical protein
MAGPTFVLLFLFCSLTLLVICKSGCCPVFSMFEESSQPNRRMIFASDRVLGAERLRREKYSPARARCVASDEAETDQARLRGLTFQPREY